MDSSVPCFFALDSNQRKRGVPENSVGGGDVEFAAEERNHT